MLEESKASETPIEQVIKNILLGKKEIPDWIQNQRTDVLLILTGDYPQEPIEEKKFYENLWYFDHMTTEQIQQLDNNALWSTLALLEDEQQDHLVSRLPENLKKDFWDLVRQHDSMNGIDEAGN